mgnify:CR=1 FL=1
MYCNRKISNFIFDEITFLFTSSMIKIAGDFRGCKEWFNRTSSILSCKHRPSIFYWIVNHGVQNNPVVKVRIRSLEGN